MGDFIDTLPPKYGSECSALLLDAVANGYSSYKFVPIISKYKNYTATFRVFEDALKIEDVRINVSAMLQQNIADLLGCVLLTAKLADLIHSQAKTIIPPLPRKIYNSTKQMIAHSLDIDHALKKYNYTDGLVSTVGKHWIIDETLRYPKFKNMSINYGWHFNGSSYAGIKGEKIVSYKEIPNVRVIQGRGYRHDHSHADYSQVCVLVSRSCDINGQSMDMIDLLKDEELAFLANHSGKMSVFRQP